MKVKTIWALAAAVMLSTAAMAQDENQGKKHERRQMDPTAMAEKRTEAVAKKYGLNDNQQAKLLELNKKYADQMGPRRGGQGRMDGKRGNRGPKVDGQSGATMPQGKEPSAEQKAQMEAKRKEFKEKMEAYDAELQNIMTKEQYEAYKADQKKQRPERRQRPDKR